jgi:hypothetical protein
MLPTEGLEVLSESKKVEINKNLRVFPLQNGKSLRQKHSQKPESTAPKSMPETTQTLSLDTPSAQAYQLHWQSTQTLHPRRVK